MPSPPPATPSDDAPARAYAASLAASLLSELKVESPAVGEVDTAHPAVRWAQSGLMHLTGSRQGPPEFCPAPLPSCADGALAAFRLLAEADVLPGVQAGELLAERAALMGFERNGGVSLQGHCRLLASADGRIALNLARPADWDLLPAWFGRAGEFDWATVAREVAARHTGQLLAQGRLLGLATVDATAIPEAVTPWFTAISAGKPRQGRGRHTPRVVDLSSLWAGPLCSHLWQQAGAEVVKVESSRRPDGAREGSPAFFQHLNRGKTLLSLDLQSAAGRSHLRELIAGADIVLEASRPRALQQMGIDAHEILRHHPGKTWVSLTGYGRPEPEGNWIAYGDDAGVAAGLSALLHRVTGQWLICGDAIADPLTGLHAALAGWACWRGGGGHLVDIALERVVRHCITATAPQGGDYAERYRRWRHYLDASGQTPRAPRPRSGDAVSTR